MQTRLPVLVLFLLIPAVVIPATATAGDLARFTNLGFSQDSRTFAFAQHGINHQTGHPFAEVFLVDVPGNVFRQNGVARNVFTRGVSPGQDGSGAMLNVLRTLTPQLESHGIDHLNQGRIIHLAFNETEPRPRVEFRDFQENTRYTIAVTQESRGRGTDGSAAFHLDITARFTDGTTVEHRVGRPGFFREGVNRYAVGQVILAPDERSLVVVMERITDVPGGRRIRYMVETVRLR